MMRAIRAASLIALLAGSAVAQDRGCLHEEGPPNSPKATSDAGGISWAFFFGQTEAYLHGVLGDTIEARAFMVDVPGTEFCDIAYAAEDHVFEDVSPRLVDVTGDGENEVIVVASHMDLGARLEVWGYPAADADLTLLAATPHIGTRFRWLAPIGAADLDGDGAIEIAYVDRPHLAKILRVWRYEDGRLTEVAAMEGVSNHRIGELYISGGIRSCGGPPEMIVADAGWRSVLGVSWTAEGFDVRQIGPFDGRASFEAALRC